jgi:transcriptional regulator with XRE-family HTH domain
MGSTTSVRAREMRLVLADWQRGGLTQREFAEKHGIPLSTLSWWRRVFREAGAEELNGTAAENAVVFTEVRAPASVSRTPAVVEIVVPSGHLVRVPAGADSATLRQVLETLRTTC